MKLLFKIALLFLLISSCTSSISDKKKHLVGISQFALENSDKKSMIEAMEIEAKFHKDIELLILDGKNSIDQQIEDIETLIENKVDVLIISPIAPKPLRASIQKAIKANISVIVLDRELEGVNYSSFIGANNFEIGENAAKYIESLNKPSKIVEIKGWAGTTPTFLRTEGFKSVINSNESLEVVGVVQDIYDNPGIQNSFRKFVETNQDFNSIYAHTDALAFQAYEVLKEFNLQDKIDIVGVGGFNGEQGGLDLVEKNILSSTVLYPTGGKEAIRIARKLLNKEEVQQEYLLPSLMVDKTNVTVLKRQQSLIAEQQVDIDKQQSKLAKQIQLFATQSNYLKFTLLLLGLIGFLLFMTYRSRKKIDKQRKLVEESNVLIESQKKEIEVIAEDLRVTNEATNNFFTGVSHDFKTPVSLIMSSTESLLERETGKKPQEYALIHNNSKRLLRMINELLDFKRVESNKFRLQVIKTNIYDFLHSIFLDFEYEAENNKIDFKITTNTKDTHLFIDQNLFDNIFFNLFSNAFKFTPIGGNISVDLKEEEKGVYISIKDSGIGIIESEKEKIFQQFFQGSNNKQTSSGVGLYLAKEYSKLHGGDVEVFSEEGKGAEFRLFIPKGKSHFSEDQIVIDADIAKNDTIDIDAFEFEDASVKNINNEDQESLLIIEDNSDLRLFLKNKLSQFYKVYESEGIDAVEKAFEIIPDIIISDVNLPEKNGFEITEILKNDERTSHIPTIILTALSSDQAHLKGLQSGVDMFLTKPFNLSVLYQSIQSLLYNRKKLQLFYKKQVPAISIEEAPAKKPKVVESKKTKSLDQNFLEKINTLIEKNIDDSTFTVEVLAEEIGISRVQLYRKVKAMLGISISDIIQEKRLEKSKSMLIDDNYSIADIAYSVGFSSPNYFSTAFKNKFGITPKQYIKEQSKKV